MPDTAHLERLDQGVAVWNDWMRERTLSRTGHSEVDLGDAYLSGADLQGANFFRVNLSCSDLRGADLRGADFLGANLAEVDLTGADLRGAQLMLATLDEARLAGADLRGADLCAATLRGADMRRANLRGTSLVSVDVGYADLTGADLTGCRVHGVSAWRVKVDKRTRQRGLVVSAWNEPEVTVDDIEVAQFADLLLHDDGLRDRLCEAIGPIVPKLGLGALGAARAAWQGARARSAPPGGRPRGATAGGKAKQPKAREIPEPESA